ncbi:hypothetical protein EGW08_023310 [Elysia chlorotica]|uniref:Guanylate cyclase domain-containing protein n=1 Tax=Elysia chlorotica TaxID=188477 RepID=A0A3S0Z1W2_ELYCH|nr:hypothetical protein EGW08_023310 [Elysia chlorotica]
MVSGVKVEAESFPNVTIFFSDIVGFTSICGRCSPQEVLDFLNELYTNFDIVLNSYNVYKVETIGDAYMVAGGIPEPTPDHAQQIAFLALHLLSVSASVKAPYVTQKGERTQRNLRLRIGLNSGPVVAGIVGEKMPRYCLYGNTVNIASRMESNGKALRVHMSRETTQELEAIGGFDISYRGMISVKGKDMPVPTYWLNNSLTHPFELPDWTTAEDGD